MRRTAMLQGLWFTVWLIAAPVPAFAEEAAFSPEGNLADMLAEKTKDGAVTISTEARAYFDGLPSHAKKLFAQAADDERISSAAHLNVLLSLDLGGNQVELLLEDNCILCHTDEDNQDEETLFTIGPAGGGGPRHLNIKELVSDVHFRRGLSCAGCHGGSPSDTDMGDEIYARWPPTEKRHADRTWIPEFCARCHADPAFMRGFNPSLPTDQLAKYKQSLHGRKLLQEGDSKVAQCVSCHGVHGIRGPNSPQSTVYPKNIPETCGACHADPAHMKGYTLADGSPIPTDQLTLYRTSVHGKALFDKGDIGAPACNDCHGNHAAMPPKVAAVSQVCRTCHSGNGALFDGSAHKRSFAEHNWPECDKCHGNHGITKTSDAMLGDVPGTLCYDCHSRYSKNNPKCRTTAAYFRESIDGLAADAEHFEHNIETLAERGLDVEGLSGAAGELDDALRQARSRIHSFDRSDFDQAAAPGREAVEKGNGLIAAALDEYRVRRNGLVVAIALMALMALGLYLKLREIEGRAER